MGWGGVGVEGEGLGLGVAWNRDSRGFGCWSSAEGPGGGGGGIPVEGHERGGGYPRTLHWQAGHSDGSAQEVGGPPAAALGQCSAARPAEGALPGHRARGSLAPRGTCRSPTLWGAATTTSGGVDGTRAGGGGGFGQAPGPWPHRLKGVQDLRHWGAEEAPGGYLTFLATAHGGRPCGGLPRDLVRPRESIRRSLGCSLPVLPLDRPQPSGGRGTVEPGAAWEGLVQGERCRPGLGL